MVWDFLAFGLVLNVGSMKHFTSECNSKFSSKVEDCFVHGG